MIYLTQILGNPVYDCAGERIGVVSDLGIATGEVFPRVTSLAFVGPGKIPFMISWRKYVESFDEDEVHLKVASTDIRFSYLQPEELLIARDLLNKQIVDTQGMKVVRVNDLKLSDYGEKQLRLLGAEVGARGLLRSLSPVLERAALSVSKTFGKELPERLIAWNYMDLIERDLSDVKLSVTHKTLDELHPADVADIIEQLDPRLRGQVFAQLDRELAADAMAELDDDEMAAQIVEDMDLADASKMLSEMDPDDAAELVSELDYERAERLLRLMGVKERQAIRQLLGYREDTAGRIMTSAFVSLSPDTSVAEAIEHMRAVSEDVETFHYLYITDETRQLKGVVSLHELVLAESNVSLGEIATTEIVSASPEDDQEDVAKDIAKYNLLAMPVVDDNNKLLGIVTVDDALDVLEEEHEEDLQIVSSRTGVSSDESSRLLTRLLSSEMWIAFWLVSLVVLLVMSAPTAQASIQALVVGAALPVCLRAANAMVRAVTSLVLEFDADDDDAPSALSFTLRGVGSSIIYGLIIALVTWAVEGIVMGRIGESSSELSSLAVQLISLGKTSFFLACMVSVVMFALTPILLSYIRHNEANDKVVNGLAIRAVALLVAAALFIVAAQFIVIPSLG